MIETIPSRWMRDYFKKVNRELSDKEKATMIWNVPNVTWNERLDALKEIGDETEDCILQEQIRERILFEQEEFRRLKENSEGKFVYLVEDDDGDSYGCFSEFETAYERLLKCIDKYKEFRPEFFEIKKYYICGASEMEDCFDSIGFPDDSVTYDMQGNIIYLYTSSDNDLVNNWRNRFEGAFFRIPCGINYCSVKNLVDNSYGVVHSTEESWEAYMDKWSNCGLDYSDIQVVVHSLTENGVWSHRHVNPLFLEPQMPEEVKDDKKRMALIEATNALVKYFEAETEDNAKNVIVTAKKYAEECQNEKIAKIQCVDRIFC